MFYDILWNIFGTLIGYLNIYYKKKNPFDIDGPLSSLPYNNWNESFAVIVAVPKDFPFSKKRKGAIVEK